MEDQGHAQGGELGPGGRLPGGPPAYQARTPWRPLSGLIATALIVAISILAAVLLVGLAGGSARSLSLPQHARGEPGTNLVIFAVWQVLVVLLTVLASTLFGGRPRDVLALGAAGGWRPYASAILAMAALQVGLAIVQHSLMGHDLMTDLRPFVGMIRGPDWALTALVVGIGAPLSEELLFRGFLLSALARAGLGFWGGALLATALWTALHAGYSVAGMAEVFVIGLFFSWLLWRTGSLRVAILCHALYNSLIVVVLRFVDLSPPA